MGWNSTKEYVLLRLVHRVFQFPTGWNSTLLVQTIGRIVL